LNPVLAALNSGGDAVRVAVQPMDSGLSVVEEAVGGGPEFDDPVKHDPQL
jgi:hypothetical protein